MLSQNAHHKVPELKSLFLYPIKALNSKKYFMKNVRKSIKSFKKKQKTIKYLIV